MSRYDKSVWELYHTMYKSILYDESHRWRLCTHLKYFLDEFAKFWYDFFVCLFEWTLSTWRKMGLPYSRIFPCVHSGIAIRTHPTYLGHFWNPYNAWEQKLMPLGPVLNHNSCTVITFCVELGRVEYWFASRITCSTPPLGWTLAFIFGYNSEPNKISFWHKTGLLCLNHPQYLSSQQFGL